MARQPRNFTGLLHVKVLVKVLKTPILSRRLYTRTMNARGQYGHSPRGYHSLIGAERAEAPTTTAGKVTKWVVWGLAGAAVVFVGYKTFTLKPGSWRCAR